MAAPLGWSILQIDSVDTVVVTPKWFTCEFLSTKTRSDHGSEESIAKLIAF
jgi:hypothetical protein